MENLQEILNLQENATIPSRLQNLSLIPAVPVTKYVTMRGYEL
jgi:hypothetical protein